MTNRHHSVLYTGVCNNIVRRVLEHKLKYDRTSFTAKYNVTKLVYLQYFENIDDAITREKQIKAGSRKRKIDLIENMNPEWKDLSEEW